MINVISPQGESEIGRLLHRLHFSTQIVSFLQQSKHVIQPNTINRASDRVMILKEVLGFSILLCKAGKSKCSRLLLPTSEVVVPHFEKHF